MYRENKKDYTEAMNWYNKTLEIKPKERKACYGIGYCLNSKGKYSDAISYLKVSIEQELNYTAAYVELGYSYYKLDNYSEALVNFKKQFYKMLRMKMPGIMPHWFI